MRILISSVYHFSQYLGGNERHAHAVASELARRHHQVTYLSSTPPPTQALPYSYLQLPIWHFMGKPLPSLSWLRPTPLLPLDLHHAFGSGLPLLALSLALKPHHVPSLHLFAAPSYPTQTYLKLGNYLERRLLTNTASALITTSPKNRDYLATHLPTLPHYLIPLFVDPIFFQDLNLNRTQARQLLKLPLNTPLLLFIGRLDHHHPYKGLPILLSACLKLKFPFHLLIIGSGNLYATYKNLIAHSPLKPRVIWRPSVSDQDLPAYYRSADLTLLPSTTGAEGFGLVLIESMAVKTATLTTTAIGLSPWLIKSHLSYLVPPNDSLALARQIEFALHQPDSQLINRAFHFAKTLSLSQMVDRYLLIYQRYVKLKR